MGRNNDLLGTCESFDDGQSLRAEGTEQLVDLLAQKLVLSGIEISGSHKLGGVFIHQVACEKFEADLHNVVQSWLLG